MLASFVTSSSLVMGVATRSAEDWWAMGDETNARVVGTHRAAATDRERKIMVDGKVVGLIWKEVGLFGMYSLLMWRGPKICTIPYEVCFFYIRQTVCPASVWEKVPAPKQLTMRWYTQIWPPVRQYCRPHWQNLTILVPSALLWQSILALPRKRSAY